jgi:hypothetical protein
MAPATPRNPLKTGPPAPLLATDPQTRDDSLGGGPGDKTFSKNLLALAQISRILRLRSNFSGASGIQPTRRPKAPVKGVMVWLRVIRPREEAIEIGHR